MDQQNNNRVSCQFCFFDHTDPKRVIIHLLNKHCKDATFTVKCVVKDCMYSTKTWPAYRQHFKCKHNLNINSMNLHNVLHADITDEEENEDDRCRNVDRDDDGHSADNILTGKFVLSLEAALVSATAVDTIVSSTGSLIADLLQSLSTRVLSIPGIDAFHENIQGVFQEHNSFVGFNELKSHQHRHTFYRDNFMLVTPEKTLLGSKYVDCNGRQRKLVKVKKFGYFIPLLKLLEALIKIPQIQRFIQEDHMSTSGYMKDVCDGHYIKSDELKQERDIFIQFIMSYDDLELQNLLRSNKTHKLGMFYFTLLNIPPQYRSQLHNIFLLAVAKTKDLKQFGLEQLFHDFISSVKLLRDEGIFMIIDGERKHVKGDLIFAVCDTPAAAFLGGFKELSFAFKSCRMCTMTGQQMKDNFFPQNFDI